MKKTINSNGFRYTLLPILAMMTAAVAMAADAPSADDWTLTETVGSVNKITVVVGGEAVTVSFDAQGTPPSALRSDLLVGGANPSSVFNGNLLEIGYSGIRLRITGTGEQPVESSVLIRTIIGDDPLIYRDWRYTGVTVSTNAGEWTIAEIPLQRSAGWTTAGDYKLTARRLDALWLDDMADVSAMYIRLQPGGFAAQSYSVSDFRLMGSGIISEPANLTPLQHYFGVDSLKDLDDGELAALMNRDTDGDGMSDYREILAGFDPHSAASVFAAGMTVAAGRNTISWQGVLGKTYAIWRSNDLKSGFLPLIEGIQCTATGLMTRDDDSPATDKPNFYKVVNY